MVRRVAIVAATAAAAVAVAAAPHPASAYNPCPALWSTYRYHALYGDPLYAVTTISDLLNQYGC
jgi:hypothetical protein